jgi:hypothetical protein
MAAARAHGRRPAATVSQLAGEMAKTEDRVAAQRERLAATRPDRAHEVRRSAEEARSFAEHERREQERWSDIAQDMKRRRDAGAGVDDGVGVEPTA